MLLFAVMFVYSFYIVCLLGGWRRTRKPATTLAFCQRQLTAGCKHHVNYTHACISIG